MGGFIYIFYYRDIHTLAFRLLTHLLTLYIRADFTLFVPTLHLNSQQ